MKFAKGPKQRAHTIRNTTHLDILLKEHEQQQATQNEQHTSMETDASNGTVPRASHKMNTTNTTVTQISQKEAQRLLEGMRQERIELRRQQQQQQQKQNQNTNTNT